jgi:hypothetical protein
MMQGITTEKAVAVVNENWWNPSGFAFMRKAVMKY